MRTATWIHLESTRTFEALKKKNREEELGLVPNTGKYNGKTSKINAQQVYGNLKILKELMEKMSIMQRKLEELKKDKNENQKYSSVGRGGYNRYKK